MAMLRENRDFLARGDPMVVTSGIVFLRHVALVRRSEQQQSVRVVFLLRGRGAQERLVLCRAHRGIWGR